MKCAHGMIPILMAALVLDADGQGSGMVGLGAKLLTNGSLSLEVFLELGQGVTPLVMWPRGSTPWSNPCLTDAHCLHNLSTSFCNDALGSTLSSTMDYVTGSRPRVAHIKTGFTATVDKPYPAWVAVVFVGPSPPYLANVRTLTVLSPDSQSFSIRVHNPTCTAVGIPGSPFEVCMFCDNTRPFNSDFVYTADWFRDYRCSWACRQGYSEVGTSCLPAMDTQMPSTAPWVVGIVVMLGVACIMMRQEEQPEPIHTPPTLVQFTSTVTHGQIRVKIH